MNDQTSSAPVADANLQPDLQHLDQPHIVSVRPVLIGRVNWLGLWTLYMREVQRFTKVAMQTVVAPVITSILFLMVFAVAVGERARMALSLIHI